MPARPLWLALGLISARADAASFRVWAPNVRSAAVAGDFNGWSADANPLQPDGGDYYSGRVDSARAGQRYKFVLTDRGGTQHWVTDPRAAEVESSIGNGIITDPGSYRWQSPFQMPDWNRMVIYEMHVGTFAGLRGSGDAALPSRFQDALPKLDHLRDLGVNMLELLPVAEFPGDFSWGYNPSYPFAPESAYGRPDDLKALVDAAHARGIGVIVDTVHNHYGPTDLPMWCFTGDCLGHGGPYFYTDWRANTPWGATRPDYGRSEVRDYIRDAALHWVDEYHLDGLRWDATKYIRGTGDGGMQLGDGWGVLRQANDALRAAAPWKISIAEDMAQDAAVTAPTGAGGLGFGSQWDAAFVGAVRGALVPARDEDRDLEAVRGALEWQFNGQATQRVVFTESHDACANGHARLPEDIWPGHADGWVARKRSTIGAALTLTAPGIPMLLQGQEFLEDQWFSDRRGLDWSKADRNSGIVRLYHDLIALRRDLDGNVRGLTGDHIDVFHVNDRDKVLAYHRWQSGGPRDDTVVLVNFANRSYSGYRLGLPRAGRWRVRFNSDWRGYSSDFAGTAADDAWTDPAARDGLGQSAAFGLGPYSVVILSQDD